VTTFSTGPKRGGSIHCENRWKGPLSIELAHSRYGLDLSQREGNTSHFNHDPKESRFPVSYYGSREDLVFRSSA
jgi:hypothetical protein